MPCASSWASRDAQHFLDLLVLFVGVPCTLSPRRQQATSPNAIGQTPMATILPATPFTRWSKRPVAKGNSSKARRRRQSNRWMKGEFKVVSNSIISDTFHPVLLPNLPQAKVSAWKASKLHLLMEGYHLELFRVAACSPIAPTFSLAFSWPCNMNQEHRIIEAESNHVQMIGVWVQ